MNRPEGIIAAAQPPFCNPTEQTTLGFFSPKLSVREMAQLCHSLGVATRGVVPIDRALQLLSSNAASRHLRRVLRPIVASIKDGHTLAQAFRTQQKYLPDEFIELIAAAELGGTVEVALGFLAEEYERRLQFQRLVISEMTYPVFLWLASSYIIPLFRGMMLTNAPVETYFLQFGLRVALSWGPALLCILVLGRLGLLERIGYALFSHLWPASGILRNIEVVRFLRTLAMLLEAGLSAPKSIERATAATKHPRLRRALGRAVPMVQNGSDLTSALASTAVLPPMGVAMLNTGEHAGTVEQMLRKTAEYIEASASHRGRVLRSLFFGLWFPALLATYLVGGMATAAGSLLLRSLGWGDLGN